jgi:hypothetical protein
MVPILRSLSILLLTTSAAGRIFPGTPNPSIDPDYTTADRNANYSHTVTFQHSDRANAGTWQWTLRVSEVPAYKYSENYAPGFHQAYTTYSFAWPGDGTLDDALRDERAQDASLARTGTCAVLLTILFPPDITATYDDSSSDCTSMLDKFCVAALKRMVAEVEFDDQRGKCRFSDNGFQAVGGLACREYTEPNDMGGLGGTVTRKYPPHTQHPCSPRILFLTTAVLIDPTRSLRQLQQILRHNDRRPPRGRTFRLRRERGLSAGQHDGV